jgi:hypothetical protein
MKALPAFRTFERRSGTTARLNGVGSWHYRQMINTMICAAITD